MTNNANDIIEETIENTIQKQSEAFRKVLPPSTRLEAFVRMAQSVIRADKNLEKCDPNSVLGCLLECAQLDLVPSKSRGPYLVPFKGKVTLIMGYKRILDLLDRSGKVFPVNAKVVYGNDVFEEICGTDQKIIHKPAKPPNDRGAMIGAYCIIKRLDGGVSQRFMDQKEIESHRPPRWQDTPWKQPKEKEYVVGEMWVKTVILAVAKLCPLSVALGRAVEVDALGVRGGHLRWNPEQGAVEAVEDNSKEAVPGSFNLSLPRAASAAEVIDAGLQPDAVDQAAGMAEDVLGK